MTKIKVVLLGILIIYSASGVLGQSKDDQIEKYMPTENLDHKKEANRSKNRPKRKNYDLIYKNDTKGILYGNPCALEETHRMGFEYIVEKETLPGSKGKVGKIWNNFLINTKLIFTRSPFWKLILNKRFRECREKTGDIVG